MIYPLHTLIDVLCRFLHICYTNYIFEQHHSPATPPLHVYIFVMRYRFRNLSLRCIIPINVCTIFLVAQRLVERHSAIGRGAVVCCISEYLKYNASTGVACDNPSGHFYHTKSKIRLLELHSRCMMSNSLPLLATYLWLNLVPSVYIVRRDFLLNLTRFLGVPCKI
jgi:hypothetical protein